MKDIILYRTSTEVGFCNYRFGLVLSIVFVLLLGYNLFLFSDYSHFGGTIYDTSFSPVLNLSESSYFVKYGPRQGSTNARRRTVFILL